MNTIKNQSIKIEIKELLDDEFFVSYFDSKNIFREMHIDIQELKDFLYNDCEEADVLHRYKTGDEDGIYFDWNQAYEDAFDNNMCIRFLETL